MEMVGGPTHRQSVEAAPARAAVDQRRYFDGVGIEQVSDRAEHALEVDEPVVISPAGD
jgi:hypothetical protein